MKITVCGSMIFSKQMLEIENELLKNGYEVFLPLTVFECCENPNLNSDLEFCIKNDVQMDHFKKIKNSDCILVLNYHKNGIDGYIGGSTLMEIAIAKYLGKKIYILNNLPDETLLKYALEIKLTQPIIINGDLSLINI